MLEIKERPSDIIENPITDPALLKTQGYRAVLKNKNFLALWLAQIFSQLADRVIFVVFVAFIAHSFSTSITYQSWLYIAFTIPAVLLTAIAGVFIDKWNKKYILITTNLLRAGLIIALPFFSQTLFGIYTLAFLVSSVTQFFVPAEASSIPLMVKKHQLMSANSLFTATMMGSLIFGFALGDPLINIFGLKNVNIAISAFFIISALFLVFIKYRPCEHEKTQHKTIGEFIDDFKKGFNYIKGSRVTLNALLKLTALFSIIVMLCILAISISQQLLYPHNPKLGAQKFVYVVAFSGIGMILGAGIVGRYLKNFNKLLTTFIGFTGIGAGLVMLSGIELIPNNLYIPVKERIIFGFYLEAFNLTWRMIYSYAVAGIIGFGCAMAAIPVQTILHTVVPEQIRGKIFGIQFTLLSTASTLPILIAAFAADLLGVTKVLVLAGIPIALFGVWGMVKNSRVLQEN